MIMCQADVEDKGNAVSQPEEVALQTGAGKDAKRREFVAVVFMEESAEVITATSKCLRFGWDRNWPGYGVNIKKLSYEFGEMLALADELDLDPVEVDRGRLEKMPRVMRWFEEAQRADTASQAALRQPDTKIT